MRHLFACLALAGCPASLPNDPPDPPDDGGGKGDAPTSAFAPAWSYTTPASITQLPEEDVSDDGGVRLGLRGFDQIAPAPAGSERLRIVPRRAALGPLRLLTETANNRTLVWMLEPLGVIWH